jgi:hypothetical protein
MNDLYDLFDFSSLSKYKFIYKDYLNQIAQKAHLIPHNLLMYYF